LQSQITSINDSINHTQSSLIKFEQQIADYKDLTKNLNDDVKSAISNSEKKYSSLHKRLSQLKNAVSIAKVEINDVIDEFNQRANANDVLMPSCHKNTQLSKANLVQDNKLTTSNKAIEIEKKPNTVQEKAIKNKEVMPPDVEYANKMATESINSMKNIMKSVFKADKRAEQKTEHNLSAKKTAVEEPLSMAERLKLAQNNV
jgi:hypothetical protein